MMAICNVATLIVFLATLLNVKGYFRSTRGVHNLLKLQVKSNENTPKPVPKITFGNLIQLITMGAGAPMLGEFDRVDPETGKIFFKLEANNLVDSEGNSLQTKAKYFTDGYVETDDGNSPPNFWDNLKSGGKLQAQWEADMVAKRNQPLSNQKKK